MDSNLLGAIANNNGISDISAALDYRQARLDRDEAKRKEIKQNQIIGKALSTGLVDGSPMAELAKANPTAYIGLAKVMGIDPSMGSGVNQMTQDAQIISAYGKAGDVNGAINYMQESKAQRDRLGLPTHHLTSGLQAIQEDMPKFFRATNMIADTFHPVKGEQMTAAQAEDAKLKREEFEWKKNNPNAGAPGDGSTAHAKDLEKYQQMVKEGNPDADNFAHMVGLKPQWGNDAETAGNVQRSKTSAEVGTKQSLDLADKYYQKIAPINNAIANFDDATRLIDSGAGTGKIESLLPSFRQSSIELDNVRRNLGLNVIQNTTFGALSEGELKLALDTALPTGLDAPQLKQWIANKKDAQVKMRDYLENAVSYLGDGHSIADLSKQQRNERAAIEKKTDSATKEPVKIGRFQVEVH